MFKEIFILSNILILGNFLTYAYWLTSCKPCGDTLNECSQCLKDECVQCIIEIPYTGCLNCLNDMLNLESRFYCDQLIGYHQTVCRIHCRMNGGDVLYRDGYCDGRLGHCVCTTSLLTTTAHPLLANRTTTSSSFNSCQFKINFEQRSQIQVVNENVTEYTFRIKIEPLMQGCVLTKTVKAKIKTKSYSATEGLDYLGLSLDLEFNYQNLYRDVKVYINDDNLIEPFEFFTLEITDVNPPEYGSNNLRKIIYIEDNDYNTPNGQETDVLELFEIGPSYINVVYKDRFDQNVYIPNPFNIFPKRGGISSPYDKLKVIMQINGAFTLKIHTIEVNNPQKCNLNAINLRRLDFGLQPLDSIFLNSLILNNRTVVDVNYLKAFQGLSSKGDEPDFIEINFLSTRNGQNAANCELRAFAEEVY